MLARFGYFLQRCAERLGNAGYLLAHPAYASVRKSGGARDLYRLLDKPWLRREAIRTVLDVGANEGQFAKTARLLFPQARILAFEPNPEAAAKIERLDHVQVVRTACGREKAAMSLHVAQFSPASSLLAACRSKDAGSQIAHTIEVQVERLDAIVPELRAEAPCFLKIDVQGFEKEVIEGAAGVLDRVEAVVCEVCLAPFYEHQARLDEIVALLDAAGFRLVDIGAPVRAAKDSEILYLDLAFLNAARCES